MITLGVEMSSPRASVAVDCDGTVTAEVSWTQVRRQPDPLFRELPRVLQQAGVDAAEVGAFVVGRGPGSFSGMRASLTAVRAMALVSGAAVAAVSSGRALAAAVLKDEEDAEVVAVVGDARRGMLWAGFFERGPHGPVPAGAWALFEPAALAARLPEGAVAVTSEPDRVTEHLAPAGGRLLRDARFPDAAGLLAEARRGAERGAPGEPLSPIYLHPAV